MASNNPYERFNENEEAQPIDAAPPPVHSEDRGEPQTKAPRKKRNWKVLILVVLIVLVSIIGIGAFGFAFYRNVVAGKAEQEASVRSDPALEQKTGSGPDLGAYQERVARELAEKRKKEEAERLAREQQQKLQGQGAQGGTASAPSLGQYGNQQPSASSSQGGGSGNQKPEPTPAEKAAARRWENDVMWDEKNATGGRGQERAARTGESMDRYYSQNARNQNGQVANPSFEERMASNPYLNGNQGAGGGGGSAGSLGGSTQQNSIGGMLATESYPAGTASIRPDTKFLLIHGTSIPCTMVPRVVTNYPGMTRCMINKDVYSADQTVVVIKAGSFANGERKVSMKQGVAKVFVAWRDIETPDGVTIRLDSLAADQLGASGIDAWVDNHYPERFGGAILLSLFDDTFKALANSTRSGNGGVTFDSSTQNGQDMASIALENSINMEPTGYINQAVETTILVARDVDFRSVYGVQ